MQLDEPIDPCHHMKVLLSRLSDDTLKGLAKWYTEFHAAGCPKCRTAVEALRRLPAHVRYLAQEELERQPEPTLSRERWIQIEEAWQAPE